MIFLGKVKMLIVCCKILKYNAKIIKAKKKRFGGWNFCLWWPGLYTKTRQGMCNRHTNIGHRKLYIF